jgi:ABC-type uncharacterized transport system fused permease/ATPase subunit
MYRGVTAERKTVSHRFTQIATDGEIDGLVEKRMRLRRRAVALSWVANVTMIGLTPAPQLFRFELPRQSACSLLTAK